LGLTIAVGNVTADGTFPELNYFYYEYFLNKIEPNDPTYKNIKFPTDWALKVLNRTRNYNPYQPEWLKDSYLLLNIGNIAKLLAYG